MTLKIYQCGNKGKDGDCECGGEHPLVDGLSREEFILVTKAFIERLGDGMARAGCNDAFPEEFGESVCKRFTYDHGVLAAWEQRLEVMLDQESED